MPTCGVSQNPLLLSLASTINQMAGGRALAPNTTVPRMARGGVSQTVVRDQLRGPTAGPSAAEVGAEVAKALRKAPLVPLFQT